MSESSPKSTGWPNRFGYTYQQQDAGIATQSSCQTHALALSTTQTHSVAAQFRVEAIRQVLEKGTLGLGSGDSHLFVRCGCIANANIVGNGSVKKGGRLKDNGNLVAIHGRHSTVGCIIGNRSPIQQERAIRGRQFPGENVQ